MSDPSSWIPATPTGLSDDHLHKLLAGTSSSAAPASSDTLVTLNTGQSSDHPLLSAAGKASDYGSVANGTYDYSRAGYLQTIGTLSALHATQSSTNTLATPTGTATGNANSTVDPATLGTVLLEKEDDGDGDDPAGSSGSGRANSVSDGPDGGGNPETINVPGQSSSGYYGGGNVPIVTGGTPSEPGSGGGAGSSPNESITVIGKRNGFDHVVERNGTYYMSNGHGGIISSAAFSSDGGSVTVTPMPLDKIEQATSDLYKSLYNRDATDQDRLWISQQLSDDGKTWQQIRSYEATNDEARAVDAQAWTNIHGRDAHTADLNFAMQMIQNGATLQQYRSEEAHDDQSVADIKSFYRIILGRDADQGSITTYTNALGTTMDRGQVTSAIATSAEATGQINAFLQNSFGQITDDLRNSAAVTLSNIAQAYQSLQYVSSDTLQSFANSYKTIFEQGNILQSLMPNTWQGWVELGAMVAIDLTPPGEAVAAGEIIALGGEKLIQESFHILESRSIVDILSGVGNRVTQKLDDVIQQISSKTGQTEQEVKKAIEKDLDNSSNLPDPSDKSGQLTRAGRAAQKHGSRPGSVWPSTSGNPQAINSQASQQIEKFLNDSTQFTVRNGNSVGGFDLLDANGAGLRFDQDGKFITFLEP